MDESKLNKILILIRKDAAQRREDAAYGGSHSDGGAGHLEELVKFYKLGIVNIFPPEWEKYEKQYNKENDPDYEKYLMLKNRFG